MLDDVRRGVWSELYTGRPADAFRREMQNAFLTTIASKLNPQPENPIITAQRLQFGVPRVFASDDAKSQLRGTLVVLRNDLRAGVGRSGDRATQLHFQGSIKRIDDILDPNRRAAAQ